MMPLTFVGDGEEAVIKKVGNVIVTQDAPTLKMYKNKINNS